MAAISNRSNLCQSLLSGSWTALESLELWQCQVSARSMLDQGPVFVVQSSLEDVGICTEFKIEWRFLFGEVTSLGVYPGCCKYNIYTESYRLQHEVEHPENKVGKTKSGNGKRAAYGRGYQSPFLEHVPSLWRQTFEKQGGPGEAGRWRKIVYVNVCNMYNLSTAQILVSSTLASQHDVLVVRARVIELISWLILIRCICQSLRPSQCQMQNSYIDTFYAAGSKQTGSSGTWRHRSKTASRGWVQRPAQIDHGHPKFQ